MKSLSPASQLLMRHVDALRARNPLIVNYPADSFCVTLRRLLPQSRLTAFGFDYASYRHVAAIEGGRLIFGPFYTPSAGLHDLAIVYLPKSRALLELTLKLTVAALQPGGRLFLVGENKAGIRSVRSVLQRWAGEVTASHAARHCVLFEVGEVSPQPRAEAPDTDPLKAWASTFTLEIRGHTLRLVSFPGVFSHGRLDDGTRFLLENLALPPQGQVLDFGCGCGVIGAAIQILWPEISVDLVDANALALEASRRTLAANHLPVADIRPSDVFSDVRGMYTHIVSNPPFHRGVGTDYRVVEDFIRSSGRRLAPGGSLWIVANRFLKYRPLIEKHFSSCRLAAENRRYCVYEAIRH